MPKVYLSLGANLESPFRSLITAITQIKKMQGVTFKKRSAIYLTSPVSKIPQNEYLNLCCLIETNLPPIDLFQALKLLEEKFGKIPPHYQGPRTLGIDILFYENQKLETQEFTLPHPEWQNCLFYLIPLYEISKTIEFPGEAPIEISPLIENFSLTDTQKITIYHHMKEPNETIQNS